MIENDAASLVGETIAGKYAVEQLLALGGMGAVYRARQVALDRTVALKILHPDLACDRQYVERFRIEAQAASRLEHLHSVRIIDFGEDGPGLLYIAMEYAEGINLAAVIAQEWPLVDQRIVTLMSDILAALAVAHDLGVVHRDLKPENIVVTQRIGDDGEPAEVAKVCDFGIAKVAPRQAPPGSAERPLPTLRGVLMGTPEYMSPEQARGQEHDARSDIYSVGVVLYHLLAGRVPFLAESPVATALKHVTDAPVRPSAYAPTVNRGLEAICLKALSKDPAERYATAREMRNAIRGVLVIAAATPTQPRPAQITPPPAAVGGVPSPSTIRVHRGQGRALWIAGLAVGLAAAGAAGLAARSGGGGDQAPPVAAVMPAPAPAHTSAPAPATAAAPSLQPAGEPAAPVVVAPEPAPAASPPAPAPPPVRRGTHAAKHQRRERRLARALPAPAPAPVAPEPLPAPAAVLAPVPLPPAAQPVAPPPVKPPPPGPPWDASRATVSIVEVTTPSAVSVANIRAGVRLPLLQACYREALRSRGSPAGGTAALKIHIDVNGAVRSANLTGGEFLPAMKPCLEQAIRSTRVRDIDTGDATATIVMNFRAGT